MPSDRPTFEDFLAEQAWPDWLKDHARHVVRLKLMRGMPVGTEAEWDSWAQEKMGA